MNAFGFLISPMLGGLLIVCAALTAALNWPELSIGLTAVSVLYLGLPILDQLFGDDTQDYRKEHDSKWLNLLPPAMLGAQLIHLTSFFWLLERTDGVALWTLIPAAGVISSITAINAAHELIHRPSRWRRQIGALLLASVVYPGFKVEHVRGHHRWVATDKDPSSAPPGMSLYRFLPRAIVLNMVNACRLADQRWRHAPLTRRIVNNEALQGWLTTTVVGIVIFAIGGSTWLAAWFGQALIAIATLETINYVEHYGLRRARLPDGRFEAVEPRHSWNCSKRVSNWLLLGLQRHSDHHANAGRPFAELRHMPQAPQLPAGYACMMLVALVPPLWFRVMHARLERYSSQPPAPAQQ